MLKFTVCQAVAATLNPKAHYQTASCSLKASALGGPRKRSAFGGRPSETLRPRGPWRPVEAPAAAAGPLFYSKVQRKVGMRQPETRKAIKLGGCLRKQGVGRINQHTNSLGLLGTRDVPSPDMPPPPSPTPLGVSGRHLYMLAPAAAQQDALNKPIKPTYHYVPASPSWLLHLFTPGTFRV